MDQTLITYSTRISSLEKYEINHFAQTAPKKNAHITHLFLLEIQQTKAQHEIASEKLWSN